MLLYIFNQAHIQSQLKKKDMILLTKFGQLNPQLITARLAICGELISLPKAYIRLMLRGL